MLLPVVAVGALAPGSIASWHPHLRMQDHQGDTEQRGPAAPWHGDTQGGNSQDDSTSASTSQNSGEANAGQSSGSTNLDSAFLKKMAQSSVADIQLGQLGQQHAQNDQLHDLSKKLVDEHQKLYRQLQQTAHDRGLTLPSSADLKDQLALQTLQQQQGKSFDQELARTLLADHAALLQETQDTLGKLQNGKVKDVAKQALDKQEEDMADIRDAAKAVGISSGTIQAILQRQKKSVAPALALSGGESSQSGEGAQGQGGGSQPSQTSNEQAQPSSGKGQNEEQATAAQASGGASNQPQAPSLDSAFLKRVAQAGAAESQFSRLGTNRAQSSQLADFSRKLEQDNQYVQQKLKQTAQGEGVSLPQSATLEDQLALKRLQQKQDKSFDRELAKQFLADQAALLQETQDATNKLQSAQVQKFATQLAEDLQQRLTAAKQAAKSAGLDQETIQATVQSQEKAAGAASSPGGQGASQGSSGKQQGEQETAAPVWWPAGPHQEKPGGSATSSSGQGQESSQDPNRGPSPIELQQQRAHQSATQSEEGKP